MGAPSWIHPKPGFDEERVPGLNHLRFARMTGGSGPTAASEGHFGRCDRSGLVA